MKRTKSPEDLIRAGAIGSCVIVLGICFAAALAFALFRKADSFILTLGDAFIVEALVCFGLAWIGYLKKDGVRVFPPKKNEQGERPESWKDRIPQLGQEPPSPSPIPGPAGPGSAEYNRLVEAEDKLRRRILGADENPDITVSGQGGRIHPLGSSQALLLAGAVLLLLGIVFEYALPAFLLRFA